MAEFALLVDNEPVALSAEPDSCRVDGKIFAVDIADLGRASHSVLVGQTQHAVHLSPMGPNTYSVSVDGSVILVQVQDPRRLSSRRTSDADSGRAEVRAPMPGKVVAVHVAEGTRVGKGDGLVIVEAMKMQNELSSPHEGKVVEVRVQAGDSVGPSEVLIVVE